MNKIFNQIKNEINNIPRKIRLVVVTKNVDIQKTNKIISEGAEAIGENRIEVFEKKIHSLLPVEKHFIGQIQSKKIKRIIELFDVIQSVGSIDHLKKIDIEAKIQNKNIQVLLQFNISKEEQKGGFLENEVDQVIEALFNIHNIKVIGVMGMASNTSQTDIIEKQFQLLKKIQTLFNAKYPNIIEVSMGMSGDYKIALQKGATMLRIGSIIFDKY